MTLKQAANEITCRTLRSLSSGSWKNKTAETRAGTKLSPGLGDGVCSPRLWFTPLDHFIPLLETVFRWKQEIGGEMGVIYSLGITSPWRPGGSWCWETLGLPYYGSLMLIRRCKESSRTKSPRNPREPSSQRCSYHLLAFGRLPQRSFLMPRRPSRRQPLIKCCDYSHLEPRWHSSFA